MLFHVYRKYAEVNVHIWTIAKKEKRIKLVCKKTMRRQVRGAIFFPGDCTRR